MPSITCTLAPRSKENIGSWVKYMTPKGNRPKTKLIPTMRILAKLCLTTIISLVYFSFGAKRLITRPIIGKQRQLISVLIKSKHMEPSDK